MDKIWYIDVEGRQEGPLDLMGLKNHPMFSPDVLVWRAGMAEWVAARNVPELQRLFRDEEPEPEEIPKKEEVATGREELTISLRFDPFSYLFWFLIALLLILYTFYQIITSR